MKNIFSKLAIAALALCLSAAMASAAIGLGAAKQQGLVGERPDGLIGAVSTPTTDVQLLVSQTNTERMERYSDIAAKNGTPVDQVQALAGKKLIENTAAGQYIMSASGSWMKK